MRIISSVTKNHTHCERNTAALSYSGKINQVKQWHESGGGQGHILVGVGHSQGHHLLPGRYKTAICQNKIIYSGFIKYIEMLFASNLKIHKTAICQNKIIYSSFIKYI